MGSSREAHRELSEREIAGSSSQLRVYLRWCSARVAAAFLPALQPTLLRIVDGSLCPYAVLEVSLEEDGHSKEVASISNVSRFTACLANKARSVGT